MLRRGITENEVFEVAASYDAEISSRKGRVVLQKVKLAGDFGREMLYRLVVDIDANPAVLVTVYRTSKIAKYMVVK